MDLNRYRLPNGLIGVTMLKKWNAYRDGDQAGFEDGVAQKLVANGLASFREYDEEAVRKQQEERARQAGMPIVGSDPIRPQQNPDPTNTALVRAPGGTALRVYATPEEELAALDAEGKRLYLRREELLAQTKKPAGQSGADDDGDDGDEDDEGGEKVEIPTDWRDQHHATNLKLARELGAGAEVNTKAEAEAFIQAEVDRRKAAAAQQ